jgi:hypothetical protein
VNLATENKLGQSQNVNQPAGASLPAATNVANDISAAPHFHIRLDASRNLDDQKNEATHQITAQLGKYDGNGTVTVLREISTRQTDRSDIEGKMAFSFQEVMVSRLQEHITREVLKQTNAVRIATTDEIKIAHPEQRRANETRPALEKDTGKQENITANAADSIKQDNKQIEQAKTKMKR